MSPVFLSLAYLVLAACLAAHRLCSSSLRWLVNIGLSSVYKEKY